jgi:hypothetical protein
MTGATPAWKLPVGELASLRLYMREALGLVVLYSQSSDVDVVPFVQPPGSVMSISRSLPALGS